MKTSRPKNKNADVLRKIPSIDKILNTPEIKTFSARLEHSYLTAIIRDTIDDFRRRLIDGETVAVTALVPSIVDEITGLLSHDFRYAVNGLGIILHTGLGRAPFTKNLSQALAGLAQGYFRLQIDDEGKRADRYQKMNRLLRLLIGAEAGIFVNNNAGATLLILHALTQGKEVVISRGQLIEIGGSFRIPDVMAQSGAILKEVGTTNRTHLKDYAEAINEKTGALMRVHQSNYRITGFTKEVPLVELVALGKKHSLPVIDDLGSGALIDLAKFGLPAEPTVQESIKTGADVVCFSGDKLIGGPQSGIIVGKKKFIELIKKDPLHRALRCDKMTSAALEATLQLFLLKEEVLLKQHTVLSLLVKPLAEIKKQAYRCARAVQSHSTKLTAEIKPSVSEVGGGTLSTEQLPTFVIALKPKTLAVGELAKRLRTYPIPIFGRIEADRLLLDFRTVIDGEEKIIVKALAEILKD